MRRRRSRLTALPLSAAYLLSCLAVTAKAQTYTSNTDVTQTITVNSTQTMSVQGCTVRLKGRIDAGLSASKLTVKVSGGGKFYFDQTAQMDNNTSEGVNARPLFFEGTGPQDTIDHHVAFDADHTGFDTTKSPTQQIWDESHWHADGMSSNYYRNCTYITRSSKNLPTIHKRSGTDLTYTHHGLLNFEALGSGVNWVVTDNDQTYDGGVAWNAPLTLVASKSLTITGVNCDAAKVHFGSLSGTGAPLVKRGTGTLYLRGTQAYNSGASIVVEQGTVTFATDPGDPASYVYVYKTSNPGQYLTVDVRQGATAHFLSGDSVYDAHGFRYLPIENRNGVLALVSRGVVRIGEGNLDVKNACTFYSTASTVFSRVTSTTRGTVGGTLTLTGTLEVKAATVTPAVLFSAGSIAGRFSSTVLPDGMRIEYTTKEVRLTQGVPSLAGSGITWAPSVACRAELPTVLNGPRWDRGAVRAHRTVVASGRTSRTFGPSALTFYTSPEPGFGTVPR